MEAVSFLDSLLISSKNDPGLFDSLSVSNKLSQLNLSGNYDKMEVSFFPPLVVEKLKNLPLFSFSDVFGDNENKYLLYKYNYSPASKMSLSSDWVFLEQLAINKKRADVFNLWIEEQIKKTYVKIYKNY